MPDERCMLCLETRPYRFMMFCDECRMDLENLTPSIRPVIDKILNRIRSLEDERR
jgi:hypothetical protein